MNTQQKIQHSYSFQNTHLTLETGFLARQATSSVVASLGETTVLAAVVVGKPTSQDYFPLQVIYEERLYASGKIKGSRFIKREGRPSETAVLTGRMVDRSIRSLFHANIRNEIQIVITVLSVDGIHPPDTLSVIAASTALSLIDFTSANPHVPDTEMYKGPVSCVRIGEKPMSFGDHILTQIEGVLSQAQTFADISAPLQEVSQILDSESATDSEYVDKLFSLVGRKNSEWAAQFRTMYNATEKLTRSQVSAKYHVEPSFIIAPSYDEQKLSQLDLVISGTQHSITMLEAGAQIVAEDIFAKALEVGTQALTTLTQFQEDFITKVRSEMKFPQIELDSVIITPEAEAFWKPFFNDIEGILFPTQTSGDYKQERNSLLDAFRDEKISAWQISQSSNEANQSDLNIATKMSADMLANAFTTTVKHLVKQNLLTKKRRLDGRNLDEVRPLHIEVHTLPRTHGSSIFQRGETQVLNVLTLGTSRDAQILDDMEDFEEQTKRYIHHYNFPAFSVGETGRYTGPGRREIGHGALAEKALMPVLPSEAAFPYTMRLVSECFGSNGSTSMAATCSSCLSLMDGGVPIKDIVAGIAMGLVIDQTDGSFEVLTDIQGAEDHYGDMDFKVAGTEHGITAVQLDNKVAGLTLEILKNALERSRAGRLYILQEMKKVIASPRPEISKFAPRVLMFTIPNDKIGEVIGPSGKVIKSIIQKYEVEIDIEDGTGIVHVYGLKSENAQAAKTFITQLVRGYEVGDIVSGKVFRIENYGAFVKIDGTEKEGLIHISQLANNRVAKVEDVVTMHQEVTAKVVEINEKGQISLSIKQMS